VSVRLADISGNKHKYSKYQTVYCYYWSFLVSATTSKIFPI